MAPGVHGPVFVGACETPGSVTLSCTREVSRDVREHDQPALAGGTCHPAARGDEAAKRDAHHARRSRRSWAAAINKTRPLMGGGGRNTHANGYLDKISSRRHKHHQENGYEGHLVLANIFNGDVDEALKNTQSSGGQVSRARIRTMSSGAQPNRIWWWGVVEIWNQVPRTNYSNSECQSPQSV